MLCQICCSMQMTYFYHYVFKSFWLVLSCVWKCLEHLGCEQKHFSSQLAETKIGDKKGILIESFRLCLTFDLSWILWIFLFSALKCLRLQACILVFIGFNFRNQLKSFEGFLSLSFWIVVNCSEDQLLF